ncbi:T9SS type A sorting domain-containing protein [Yeosuana marina]|uniref:T9SS type A sorting domain-containing protein n=1 Tax=Yeosuana marina TaxID=1565536 RepID=UPI001422C067|nr:T9SS type A sorting domain-containing protein [Yeosuana marina]
MKRILLSTVFTFGFLINTFSQTTLSAGDLAIFMVQTRGSDDFAFVTFVDILPGTVIYFTDCGADADGFNTPCTEGAFSYTVPSGGLSAGDIIRFTDDPSIFVQYTDSRINGTSFLLSTIGDQVIAFQDASNPGGSTNAANNPRFIFVNNVESTIFAGDKTDSNETGLPNGLTDATALRTALGLGAGPGPGDEFDTAIYNGTYDFSSGGIAAAKLAFSDLSNYYQTNLEDTTYNSLIAAIPSNLILEPSLSNEELDVKSLNIDVYPNPVSTFLNIESSNYIINTNLFDTNGRLINTYNNINKSLFRISLDYLESGIYFLEINSSNSKRITRYIKI